MIETDRIALTGGSWQPVGGVLRWVPAPPRRIDVSTVACTLCGAKAHQSCRSKGGWRTKDHAERTIARRCICGSPVEPKRQLCADCKLASNRRTSAAWTERRREMAA